MGADSQLWFEVEDLVAHFRAWKNVTGIQRVSSRLLEAMDELYPERVELVRVDKIRGTFKRLVKGQESSWLSHPRPANPAFARSAKPGDHVISTGAAWPQWHFARAFRSAKRRGLRTVLMVHDILPITHPQYFTSGAAARFLRGLERLQPHVDVFIVASEEVHSQLQRYADRRNWRPPNIHNIRLGCDFVLAPQASDPLIGQTGPYVLFVSTLEVRKNHILLLRVWERLIAKYGPNAPSLMFVGRKGWLAEEVMSVLERTGNLDGKVIWHSDLSDAALHTAYDRCLFTVFPSFAEGWGLPVAESLMHGKLVVSSNHPSLRENAGPCADYFDPADPDDAFAKIERAIFEPGYRERRASEIRSGFQPAAWRDCARALVEFLDRLA